MAVANDRDFAPIDITVAVLMGTEYRTIPGTGNLTITPEAAPVSNYPLHNGRSIKRVGAKPPPSGSITALFNGVHPVMKFLDENTSVNLRIRTAPEEVYRPAAASAAASSAAIDATTGKITFAGNGEQPDVGSGNTPGEIAEGDVINIDDKKYVIGRVDGTGVFVDPLPANAVTANTYTLAVPQEEHSGKVVIKTFGGMNASASGDVIEMTIEFEYIRKPQAWKVVS